MNWSKGPVSMVDAVEDSFKRPTELHGLGWGKGKGVGVNVVKAIIDDGP
jgi:hypothetical protein